MALSCNCLCNQRVTCTLPCKAVQLPMQSTGYKELHLLRTSQMIGTLQCKAVQLPMRAMCCKELHPYRELVSTGTRRRNPCVGERRGLVLLSRYMSTRVMKYLRGTAKHVLQCKDLCDFG